MVTGSKATPGGYLGSRSKVPVKDVEEAIARMGLWRKGPGSVVGRIGRPVDIAKTIAFLLSDDAAFVTGVDLIADGGMHTRLSNAFAWGT